MNQEFVALQALLTFTAAPAPARSKGFYRLGFVTKAVAELIAQILNTAERAYELILDSDSIRHTLAQHGLANAKAELMRGQIPLVEADLLALPNWLPLATKVQAGQFKSGKQPRLELELEEATGITTVIMEWRPGRQQLALVTMYKKRPAA